METTKDIIRIAAIFILAFVFIIALFGCPDETLPMGRWMATMVISKVIAAIAFLGILYMWGGVDCVKAFLKQIVTDDEVKPRNANH